MPSCQRLPKLPAPPARVLHCRPTNCTYFNLTQFFNYETSVEKLKAGSGRTGQAYTKISQTTIVINSLPNKLSFMAIKPTVWNKKMTMRHQRTINQIVKLNKQTNKNIAVDV